MKQSLKNITKLLVLTTSAYLPVAGAANSTDMLLTIAERNPVLIQRLNALAVEDAVQLKQLLAMADTDPTQLERLVTLAGIDDALLKQLLTVYQAAAVKEAPVANSVSEPPDIKR